MTIGVRPAFRHPSAVSPGRPSETDADASHLVRYPRDVDIEPPAVLELATRGQDQLGNGVPAAAQLRRERARVEQLVEVGGVSDQEARQRGQLGDGQYTVSQRRGHLHLGHEPDGHRTIPRRGRRVRRPIVHGTMPEREARDGHRAGERGGRVEEVDEVEELLREPEFKEDKSNTQKRIDRLVAEKKELEDRLAEHVKNLEDMVAARTEELVGRVKELEELNDTMVGRELRMVELKNEVEELKKQFKNGNGNSTAGRQK